MGWRANSSRVINMAHPERETLDYRFPSSLVKDMESVFSRRSLVIRRRYSMLGIDFRNSRTHLPWPDILGGSFRRCVLLRPENGSWRRHLAGFVQGRRDAGAIFHAMWRPKDSWRLCLNVYEVER